MTYRIKLDNYTPADAGLRDLSCTISDTRIGFSKDVALSSGTNDTSIQAFTITDDASDPFVNTASVTCSPLDSTFSVSDRSIWETELLQLAVEIIKESPPYAYYGQTIVYNFTLTNQGSADTPDLVFDQDGYVTDAYWAT